MRSPQAEPSEVQNCGHLNASTIAFEAKAGFFAQQLSVKLRLCIALHKSARCVKRGIPWHIRVGTQCHGFKAPASRFSEGCIDEFATDALPTAFGNDRQLLKMGESLQLEDMNETKGIIIFRIRGDEDKTGRRRSGLSRWRALQVDVVEEANKQRVRGILNFFQTRDVSNLG